MDNFYWLSYMVEWIKSPMLDKSFRWDEWFWFGIVPATVSPIYFLLYLEKKRIITIFEHLLSLMEIEDVEM